MCARAGAENARGGGPRHGHTVCVHDPRPGVVATGPGWRGLLLRSLTTTAATFASALAITAATAAAVAAVATVARWLGWLLRDRRAGGGPSHSDLAVGSGWMVRVGLRPGVAVAPAVGGGRVGLGSGLPVSWRLHGGSMDLSAATAGFSGVGLSAFGPSRPSPHLLVARALLPSKGWSSPSCGPPLVSRPVLQDRARLAHGAAGLTSSPSRCCRTELVSRSGQQDGSVDASSGRPIGSRRWGSPRGAKGGTFPLVSFVGVAAGLG